MENRKSKGSGLGTLREAADAVGNRAIGVPHAEDLRPQPGGRAAEGAKKRGGWRGSPGPILKAPPAVLTLAFHRGIWRSIAEFVFFAFLL